MTLVSAFALDPGDEVTISHLTADARGHFLGDDFWPKDILFFIVWVW